MGRKKKLDPKKVADMKHKMIAASDAAAAAAAAPAPGAHADLGYGPPPPDDYSPAQRAAFRETFRQIGTIEAKRLDSRAQLRAAEDELDSSKENLKTCQDAVKVLDSDIEELFIHLQDIDRGTWDQKLPGMDGTEGDAGTRGRGDAETGGDNPLDPGLGEVPRDLYDAALAHVEASRAKGKGLDAASLSLALFSSRKKEHRPRCEQILTRLFQEGIIQADESDDKKARYFPAEKA